MYPLAKSSCNCSLTSFSSVGALYKGILGIRVVLGNILINNSISLSYETLLVIFLGKHQEITFMIVVFYNLGPLLLSIIILLKIPIQPLCNNLEAKNLL